MNNIDDIAKNGNTLCILAKGTEILWEVDLEDKLKPLLKQENVKIELHFKSERGSYIHQIDVGNTQ